MFKGDKNHFFLISIKNQLLINKLINYQFINLLIYYQFIKKLKFKKLKLINTLIYIYNINQQLLYKLNESRL